MNELTLLSIAVTLFVIILVIAGVLLFKNQSCID